MALRGYNSYRGRQGFWRVFLTVVLILILLAACAFLLLQRFLTYSDDGTFRLELPSIPFFDEVMGEQETTAQPGGSINLVIDASGTEQKNDGEKEAEGEQGEEPPQSQPEVEVEPESQIPQIKPYAPLRLLGFSTLPGDEAALETELEAMGADGFVFTAKAENGAVRFASTVAMPSAVSSDAVSGELLSRLCARKGIYTVAKINCFSDSLYAFANMETAGICQNTGYIWYDYSMGHWLDPEKEAARRYVIDLALECAQLGFDELLLEDMCYPAYGKIYKIDYSKNTMEKTDALVQFLTQLREELEPYGVRLSLLLTEAEINGTAEDGEATGFSAEKILPLVDAVYAATADAETTVVAMEALLGESPAPTLIPIVADETAVGGWYLPR